MPTVAQLTEKRIIVRCHVCGKQRSLSAHVAVRYGAQVCRHCKQQRKTEREASHD